MSKEAFVGVTGVRDVTMEDSIMHCTVVGSLDAVVKAASAFQVENMITHEPSLEEVFLSFYGQGDKA